jgi:hypothetical protein
VLLLYEISVVFLVSVFRVLKETDTAQINNIKTAEWADIYKKKLMLQSELTSAIGSKYSGRLSSSNNIGEIDEANRKSPDPGRLNLMLFK